jgi:hypothetical protein
MILIAAVGRSGTHYTAQLLQQMGLDVGHETVGRDGTASWKHITTGTFVVRKKWWRRRSTYIDGSGFTTVLHQVRHPLKVIASMQTFGDATWNYMAQFTNVRLQQPVLRRAMIGYLEWNRLIEPRAAWRFQIERLAEQFDTFCHHIGVEPQPMPSVPQTARDSRVNRYARLAWDDLAREDKRLADELLNLAAAYGYEDTLAQ